MRQKSIFILLFANSRKYLLNLRRQLTYSHKPSSFLSTELFGSHIPGFEAWLRGKLSCLVTGIILLIGSSQKQELLDKISRTWAPALKPRTSLCGSPWISAATTPQQRSLSFWQMEISTENYNRTQCRDQQIPTDILKTQLLHPWLREHCGKGGGKFVRARTTGSLPFLEMAA